MDETEGKIKARLYRITCPTSDQLGEYHLEMLPKDQVVQIKQHLAGCPHCRGELDQLGQYLAALAPDLETSLKERVQIFIARLIPENGMAGLFSQPAMALRGGDTGPLMYQAGDARLTVEIKEDPGRPGHSSLLGLVAGLDLGSVQARLWHEGELMTSVELDELGNFIFTGLAPGDYELILAGPEVEIHLQSLTL